MAAGIREEPQAVPGQQISRMHARHPALATLDPHTAFLYVPHTVAALLIGLSILAVSSGVFDSSRQDRVSSADQASQNAARGVWAALFVYLGYSVVQGPRTSMARPHPAVWRLVHGVLVCYVLLLVWMLFQDVHDARQFMKHLSPSLGTPVEYRTYAADCRLYRPGTGVNWGAIRGTLLDEFVLAHTLGWWAKALVVRNRLLLWTCSITFELLELSFRHLLPNFNECWWDSWVLDVALCNLIGITAGMWTVRYFECKYEKYNWQGLSELHTLTEKARRSVQQLLPYSWTRFEWMIFSSPTRFMAAMLVVLIVLCFDVNVFFLKYALWIPPTNPLNTYRLVLWFCCALPAVREYYEYLEGHTAQDPSSRFRKLGSFAWLAIAMTCLETMLSIKFGHGLYTAPWPKDVVWFWSLVLLVTAASLTVWQVRISTAASRLEREGRPQLEQDFSHSGSDGSQAAAGAGSTWKDD